MMKKISQIFHSFAALLLIQSGFVSAQSPARSSAESTRVSLPTRPSTAQLQNYTALPEPLLSLKSENKEDERMALAEALNSLQQRDRSWDFAPLRSFLKNHPDSSWSPSIEYNLAQMSYTSGHFAQALQAWKNVWEKTRVIDSSEAQRLASSAAAEYAVMLARIGRMEELEQLLQSESTRIFQGAALVKWQSAHEGLTAMKSEPGIAFRCGPYALTLVEQQRGRRVSPEFLAEVKSPRQGFSLQQVHAMSAQLGMKMQMARRAPGASLITPCVIHWKLDHYGALLREREGMVWMKDPTFGSEHWISEQVIDQEASGYFIVPEGDLPEGWSRVEEVEASQVFGKGHSGKTDDSETSDCSHQSGGNNGDCSEGMARYTFHTMLASLSVIDTPLNYTPSFGPSVPVTVRYNQREVDQPDTMLFSNFSPQWESEWMGYLEDDPQAPAAAVTVHLTGGGYEEHSDFDAETQSYGYHRRSGAILVRMNPDLYERRFADGSLEIYGHAIGNMGPKRKVFLSQIIDSQGHALTLHYDVDPHPTRLLKIVDATGKETHLYYEQPDEPYLVTRVKDPRGREATFSYSLIAGKMRLQKITDIIGLESSFTYNESGEITSLTNPYGTTQFNFAFPNQSYGMVRWIEAVDQNGHKERLEYVVNGNITGVWAEDLVPSAPGFNKTNYDIDDRNTFYWDRKAWHYHPGDYSKARLYHWAQVDGADRASGIIESRKEPFTSRLWYNYPGQNMGSMNIGSSAQPSAIARVVEDGQGGTTTEIIRREYNDLGNVTKIVDARGLETILSYAPNAIDVVKVEQKVDDTHETLATFAYDDPNAPRKPSSLTNAAGNTTTATYNTRGQIKTLTNPLGHATTYVYEENENAPGYGKLVQVIGAEPGAITTIAYDSSDRIASVTNSDGYTVSYAYDVMDRLTKVIYPDGTNEQFTYDRLDVSGHRDRAGKWTKYGYSFLQQLLFVQDAAGRLVQYEWCKCGDLQKIIDGEQNVTHWKYDVQGRTIAKHYPDGNKDTYTYAPLSGRLLSTRDRLDQITHYEYGKGGILERLWYENTSENTPEVTWEYEPGGHGRLIKMTDGIGTTLYDYFPVGESGALQVKSIDGPWESDVITYVYDILGRVETRSLEGSPSETYHYDKLGRLEKIQNGLGQLDIAYDGYAGKLENMQWQGGVLRSDYTYHGVEQDENLAQVIWSKIEGNQQLLKLGYDYDAMGRITRWQQQRQNQDPLMEYAFQYDAVGQLRHAQWRPSQQPDQVQKQWWWHYDRAGNRTSEQIDQAVSTTQINPLNQMVKVTGGTGLRAVVGTVDEPADVKLDGKKLTVDPEGKFQGTISTQPGETPFSIDAEDGSGNQVTKNWVLPNEQEASETLYTYDAAGNLTSDGERQLSWDGANRLVRAIIGGQTYEWGYDGQGRRRWEKLNGEISKTFLWDGIELLEERTPGENRTRFYPGLGEERIGENAGNYYYLTDHLGSVRALIDSQGELRAQYDYAPWGERSKVSGDLDTSVSYTGHHWHEGVGVYLTMFRHYDPLTAKWWSADPIAEDGGLNLYGYVLNNPINYWDPLGLKWYHDAAVGALEAAGGGLAMAAGFADTATFGLTSKVSNKLNDAFYGEGTGDAVDKQMECSKANKIGKFAGNFVPGSSAAAGAARLAGPGSKLLGKGSRLFGRGERHGHKGITNRGKVRFGWGWKGNRSNGRDVFRASWSKKGNRSWLNHLDYDAAGLASQAGLGALAAGDALMNSGESGSGNCD